MGKRGKVIIALCLLVVLVAGAILAYGTGMMDKEHEKVKISVMFGGDLLIHMPVYQSAQTGEGYDFLPMFREIRPYVERADIAVANLETTFSGRPYSGYPLLRCPDELAGDIKETGFDGVTNANNHAFDGGRDGALRTLDVLDDTGLKSSGIREEKKDPPYMMFKRKGVDIAILAYTYREGTPEAPTLNYNPISGDMIENVNTFSPDTVKQDVREIAKDEKQAREKGADVVILCCHWGQEYQPEQNSFQEELADMVVDETGIDAIFGGHPHVVQPSDVLERESRSDEGVDVTKVPVYYSVGNLISNQRRETLGNSDTEWGLLASFDITYDKTDDRVERIKMDPLAVWVDKYYSGSTRYVIVPLDDDLGDSDALDTSGNLSLAEAAREEAYERLGIDKKED